MSDSLDLFFVIMFMVVVSVIIGLNIVSVVDKKMSNVSIKIPPIEIPPAQITIQVPSGQSTDYQVCVNDQCQAVKAPTSPAPSSRPSVPPSRPPTPAQPESPAPPSRQVEGFASLKPESRIALRSETTTPQRVTYQHAQMEEQFPPLAPSTPELPSPPRNPAHPSPHTQLSEVYYEDPADFYRQRQNWNISLNDPVMRGANYQQYTDFVRPSQIENRITNQKRKGYQPGDHGHPNIPTGHNYAFRDSPALN